MSDMELEEIPLPPTGIIKSTKKPIKLVRKRPLSVALNQDGISDRDQKCDQKALSLEQKPSKLSTKKVVVTSWDDHIATSWDNPPSQTSIDFKDQIRQAGLEPLKISVSGDRRTVMDKNPPDQDKVLNKTNKEKEEKEKREKEKMAKVDMVFHEFLSQKMAVIEEEHKLKLKNLKEQAKKEDDEEFVFKESESGKDHKEKHKKHKKDKKKDKEKNKEKKKDRKDKDKKQKSKYKNHEHSKSRESNRDFINESDQSPCQDRSSREHSISMHKYEKDKSKKEKKKDKKDKKDKHFSDSKDKRDKSKDKGEHKRDMQSKDTHVSNTIESGDQKTNKDKSHHKNLDSEEKSDIKKQDKGEMYGDRKSASPRGDKMHRDSSNERKYSSKSDIRHQRSNSKEEFKKSRSGEERPFIESSKVKKVEEPEEITMADLIFLKKQLEAQIDKKDSKKEVKESPKEAENLEITKTVEQGAQIKSTLILNLPDKTDQHETAQDLGKDDKKIEDTEKAVKQAVDLAVVATGDVLADVIAASLVEKDAKPKGKDEDKNGSSTKRPILKLGIKISETSTALIQSGVRVEKTDVIVEEGEILDSESDTSSSSCDDADSYLDFDNSGEDADSKGKKKRKKTKKHKHKKKKKTKLEKEETKKYTKSRSRSRSPKKHKHSRSRSRSQTPTLLFDKKTGIWKENSRSKSRERRRERSRSRSPWLREKRRSRSRERRRSRSPHDRHGRDRHRSSRSREREHRDRERQQRAQQRWQGKFKEWRRSRSKEKTPVDLRLKIDKAKLREIAIANAYANAQTGSGPPINLKPEQIAAMKSGGQTVQELTEFCKKMAKKDGALSSGSDGEIKPGGSDDEEGTFIHHPFKVREAPTSIVMNIRNAKQLPVLTPAEKMAQQSTLRLQFPVSSGTQHRDKEGEWVPVEKVPPASTMVVATVSSPSVVATGKVSVAPPGAATLSVTAPPPPPPPIDDKVFPDLPPEALQPINIGAVVSERLSAMRKLQENPNDVEAMSKMYKLQKEMNHWAQSKQLPGQFTGTTGVQVLTPQELAGPDPKNQAWLKKDTFTKAKPVGQGIGMYLLQKMGWKQGTGLGKNNEGSLEPLHLDFKIDRRGLSSQDESAKKRPGPMPVVRDLSGKHPVSALMELCTKRKWGSPDFIIVNEAGPDHKKNFIFKVKVNGQEFQPATASTNKKQAKASAATVCLQELGLLPRGGSNHAGPI